MAAVTRLPRRWSWLLSAFVTMLALVLVTPSATAAVEGGQLPVTHYDLAGHTYDTTVAVALAENEPGVRLALPAGLARGSSGDPGDVHPNGVAANTAKPFSRFAVNSAGETTMFLRAGDQALEVTEHAALRMTQRGVSIDAAEAALQQKPFQYFHQDVWKTGYYDPASKIFVGPVNGQVTTLIDNVTPKYIANLQAVTP